MNPLSRSNTASFATGALSWLFNLATRLLARSLNMPEPMVHTTGVVMLAQVQTLENSVGKTLCPIRLWRQLQNWLHRRIAR